MTRRWSTTGGVSIEKQQPISVAETAGRGKSVKTEKPKTFVDKNPPIT